MVNFTILQILDIHRNTAIKSESTLTLFAKLCVKFFYYQLLKIEKLTPKTPLEFERTNNGEWDNTATDHITWTSKNTCFQVTQSLSNGSVESQSWRTFISLSCKYGLKKDQLVRIKRIKVNTVIPFTDKTESVHASFTNLINNISINWLKTISPKNGSYIL